MQETKDLNRSRWLEERRSGIGGSDAAAILGISPWGSPLTVWLEKKGEIRERAATESQYWGSEHEDAIARRYSRDTGRTLISTNGIVRHRDHPMIIGTPDRVVVGERRGVELKTADRFNEDEWGEEGTDQCPPYYLVQCAHYMAIMDFPVWDLALLVGGNRFRIYTIRRRPDFERIVMARLVAFWRDHVEAGVRPPISGEPAALRSWIGGKYPRHVGDQFAVATPEIDRAARAFIENRKTKDRVEQLLAVSEIAIKEAMGEAPGFQGDGWRASWKQTKGRTSVDWKRVAEMLAQAFEEGGNGELVAEVIRSCTRQEEGSRRFLFTDQAKGGTDGH